MGRRHASAHPLGAPTLRPSCRSRPSDRSRPGWMSLVRALAVPRPCCPSSALSLVHAVPRTRIFPQPLGPHRPGMLAWLHMSPRQCVRSRPRGSWAVTDTRWRSATRTHRPSSTHRPSPTDQSLPDLPTQDRHVDGATLQRLLAPQSRHPMILSDGESIKCLHADGYPRRFDIRRVR
jgi:hypothetical protein